MASPGQLVRTVAEVLGIPERTVVVHDRNLVAAGLRTKKGRGRSAARVNASDASNLLIAVAGSTGYNSRVKDTVTVVENYAHLPALSSEVSEAPEDQSNHRIGRINSRSDSPWNLAGLPIKGLQKLPAAHSFSDALTALLDATSDGSLMDAYQLVASESGSYLIVEVDLYGPHPYASIHIAVNRFSEIMRFGDSGFRDLKYESQKIWMSEVNEKFGDGDLKQVRSFSGNSILAIGELLGR